jgi:hypothetical protein
VIADKRWYKTILVSALLTCCISAGGGRPAIQGAYKLQFKGCYIGGGNAAVGAKSVTITAHLTDDSGNQGNLTAANMPLDHNRFNGTSTAFGLTITLIGRVDPADATLPNARIVCTYQVSSDKTGRAVGTR